MVSLFARFCRDNGKTHRAVLSIILLALVPAVGCGGNSSPNGNNNINNPTGYVISTVAGNGTAGYSGDGGNATQAELNNPTALAVDGSGNIYIADSFNNRIRKIVAATGIIQAVAGNGTEGYSGDGGEATQAELSYPAGVAVDVSGNVYVADADNNRIRKIEAATGIIQTVAGNGTAGYAGDGGMAIQAELNSPLGVAVDVSGNLFIADSLNWRVREVVAKSGVIQTVGTQASLYLETGMFVDGSDNILIVTSELCNYDPDGFLLCGPPDGGSYIEKISAGANSIQIVAGIGTQGYSGDGGNATLAKLNYPSGVSVDASGNVYIGDSANNRIREVAAATGLIQTIAGNGTQGFSGDGNSAIQAELSGPAGLVVDSAGNILFSDSSNNRVRELEPR